MRALLLVGHTSPLLVKNIIVNKIGAKALKVDPKKDSTRPIVMFSSIRAARQAYTNKLHQNSICVAICSPLDAQQIKGAIPLDFEQAQLTFVPNQLCKFTEIFRIYEDTKIKYKFRFKSKKLLQKIIDLKMSGNIVSLGQSLLYEIATKPRRKSLRHLLVKWLALPHNERPPLNKFLVDNEGKFKEMPKPMIRKFKNWQKQDAVLPVLYGDFLKAIAGKTNKEIAAISEVYRINSFDAIAINGWLK